jgi:hypothetical protein
MLSSSRNQLQWTVVMAGRQYVVDVVWPGFANHVAVNGQVVQRWRWPGNNLHTTRSFELDGVPCTIVRRRAGLADFIFELQVGAAGAVAQRTDPPGAAQAGARHQTQATIVFIVVVLALVVLSSLGIVIGIVAAW